MKRILWLLILFVSFAVPAFGGTKEDAARVSGDIAPYIKGNTPILVHFNLDQLDIEAFVTFASDVLKQGGYPDAEIQQFALVVRAGKGSVQHFKNLGIHDVYAVGDFTISLNATQPLSLIAPHGLDMLEGESRGNFGIGLAGPLIFPLAADSKADAIAQELGQFVPALGRDIVIQKTEHAIVLGPSAIMNDAKGAGEANATSAAYLNRAIESVGTHVFDIVFIPTQDMRKVLEQLMPTLPAELGGGSTTLLTRGVLFEVATIKAPPDPMVDVRVQADSAEHAQALLEVWDKGVAWARKLAAADAKGPDAQAEQAMLDAVFKLIQPKVEGDQVAFKIDSAQLIAWGKLMVPGVQQARESAFRAKSASNIRQILEAAMQYGAAQNDRWPNAMDHETLNRYGVEEGDFVDPRFPDRTPGYTYAKPTTNVSKTPSGAMVLYENVPEGADGLNVGFADGHVDWMTMEKFKKLVRGANDK